MSWTVSQQAQSRPRVRAGMWSNPSLTGTPRRTTTRNLSTAVYMEAEVRALAKAVRAPWRKNVLEYVFTL
jgi:hypothetical protein